MKFEMLKAQYGEDHLLKTVHQEQSSITLEKKDHILAIQEMIMALNSD